MQLLTLTALLVATTISTVAASAKPYSEKNEDTEPKGAAYNRRVAYTRWGRKTCPSGATLVYEGIMGGNYYKHKGGGANYLCLPKTPQYLSTKEARKYSSMYGTEYENEGRVFSKDWDDYNVPCAVCYRSDKSSKLMIPATTTCPSSSWTEEYDGYLMTEDNSRHKNAYECVDRNPEAISGSEKNRNGAQLFFVTFECNGELPCPPFEEKKAVTCVVCTA